jgi:hypothetical protein
LGKLFIPAAVFFILRPLILVREMHKMSQQPASQRSSSLYSGLSATAFLLLFHLFPGLFCTESVAGGGGLFLGYSGVIT